ncbi:hypothetical protein J437_LFUL012048 [Ladona fulva]|uniref:DDE-1 domain-containing protein n=1 Tax=Ladona fulva TaxID=123851 RepID=A0A8K0P5W1_LADFU|nr:hypothetical protein J437_LFUL012048 [Ladona fulva]
MGNIRGNWDEKDMTLAMDKVISKKMTVHAASTRCAVPKITLGDRVKNLLERVDNDLKKDAPAGSTFDAQMSGWITKDGFLKDLDVILYAKQNHIHVISLPPHTSHNIQPLDRSIMKAIKNT